MSVNIKLGDKVLTNVSQLKVADADSSGTYDTFVYGTGASLQNIKVVTVTRSQTMLVQPDTGYDAMNQVQVNVSIAKPALFAPILSVDPNESTVLHITDPDNGLFSETFEVYKNDVLLLTTAQRQLSMHSLITTPGTYTIQVRAVANNFTTSALSNSQTVVIN